MDLTRVTTRNFILCLTSMHMVMKVGKVARAIAIMSHPIPNTNESHSVQTQRLIILILSLHWIDLLGPVDEIFFKTYDTYKPVNEPTLDNCFISTSYDATTHFKSTVLDVLNMYTLITGKVLDLNVDLSAAEE
ncbi:hypothetical protein TB1_009307 [Malus domestica]